MEANTNNTTGYIYDAETMRCLLTATGPQEEVESLGRCYLEQEGWPMCFSPLGLSNTDNADRVTV